MKKCVKNSFQTTAYLQLKKIKQEKQFSDSETVKQSVKQFLFCYRCGPNSVQGQLQ